MSIDGLGQCNWIFDPQPPAGLKSGGSILDQLFDRDIRAFVRETTQNSNDQKIDNSVARIEYHIHTATGDYLDQVLDALGWIDFKRHLDAVVASNPKSLRLSRYKESNDEVIGHRGSRGAVQFLVVSDFGTKGLYGDEFGDGGNFGPLVRHSMMSPEKTGARGGSYGVGKSVLWAFSDISTAFFCSKSIDDLSNNVSTCRFIGRTQLSSHALANSDWTGDGLFGSRLSRTNGDCAQSVRIASTHPLFALGLLPSRNRNEQTGTSIIVPFFSPPGSNGVEPKPLQESIIRSLNMWFWPIIRSNRLVVDVSVSTDGNLESTLAANGFTGVENFVRAIEADPAVLKDVAAEDDDVSSAQVKIIIPGLKDPKLAPQSGEARLRVIRENDPGEQQSTVALIRGAGMVVKYLKPPGLGSDLPNFYAVLEAGTRIGSTDIDLYIENFLRASEPIAHDDWRADTDRIQKDYRQGSGPRLDEFKSAIGTALRKCLQLTADDDEDGPPELSREFSIGDGPETDPSCKTVVTKQSLDTSKGIWTIHASLNVKEQIARQSWTSDLEVMIVSAYGVGIRLPISNLVVRSGKVTDGVVDDSSGKFRVIVPATKKKVEIEITASVSKTDVDHSYIDRTGVQVRASLDTKGINQ